jgi:urease accessory protein
VHKPGQAILEVNCVAAESTVTASFATSPMKLLSPRARGRCVCTYLSNFGGGLVAGDQTRLDVRVGQNARCFIGTQASTKIYRNPHALPCAHVTTATVESGAVLVFAPAQIQPFAESRYQQRQQFRLAPGAGLALLDWFTSGRSARGERWRFAQLSTRNEVWCAPASSAVSAVNGIPVFMDACSLDEADGPLAAPHRTGRFNCFATLLLVGAPFQNDADRVLGETGCLAVVHRGSLLMSASKVRHGAVLRLAGERPEEVEDYLRGQLTKLASVLGDDPWSRRF